LYIILKKKERKKHWRDSFCYKHKKKKDKNNKNVERDGKKGGERTTISKYSTLQRVKLYRDIESLVLESTHTYYCDITYH